MLIGSIAATIAGAISMLASMLSGRLFLAADAAMTKTKAAG
jgi:hypothetical protein